MTRYSMAQTEHFNANSLESNAVTITYASMRSFPKLLQLSYNSSDCLPSGIAACSKPLLQNQSSEPGPTDRLGKRSRFVDGHLPGQFTEKMSVKSSEKTVPVIRDFDTQLKQYKAKNKQYTLPEVRYY